MPVDLAFELQYLLSDKLNCDVEVLNVHVDEGGRLCVKARGPGGEAEACIEVKSCRNLSGAKLEKCISKTVISNEKLLEELARMLEGCCGAGGGI